MSKKVIFKKLCDSLLLSEQHGISSESYNLLIDMAHALDMSAEEINQYITSADAVDDCFYRKE